MKERCGEERGIHVAKLEGASIEVKQNESWSCLLMIDSPAIQGFASVSSAITNLARSVSVIGSTNSRKLRIGACGISLTTQFW